MAEEFARNRQYEYRANSNLVLEADRDSRRRRARLCLHLFICFRSRPGEAGMTEWRDDGGVTILGATINPFHPFKFFGAERAGREEEDTLYI
jgi:hypothetical protein